MAGEPEPAVDLGGQTVELLRAEARSRAAEQPEVVSVGVLPPGVAGAVPCAEVAEVERTAAEVADLGGGGVLVPLRGNASRPPPVRCAVRRSSSPDGEE
ncbi:hypothetical protein GCM10020256_00790 [Streptomyces thermocoprophilus]